MQAVLPLEAHGADNRGGAPVAVRGLGQQALAPERGSAQPRHVGFLCRLIEEDQPGRVETALAAPPAAAGPDEVWPVLLGSPEHLFFKVRPMPAKT